MQIKKKNHPAEILLFFLLLGTHLLAVCATFPLLLRQWIWLGGTAALLGWGFKYLKKDPEISASTMEALPLFRHRSWWVAVALLAVFMRGLRFLASNAWPNFDETEAAQSAIQLSRHWDWHPFYFTGQVPALYLWLEGFLFKISGAFFFNLFSPLPVLSAATLVLGYLAARSFFPKTTAWLATLFLALSYWPAFNGSFSVPDLLLPFWECAAFALLGGFFKASARAKTSWAIALGCWTGFGFWTYQAWPVVALSIILAVFFSSPRRISHRQKVIFAVVFFMAFLPYGYAAIRGDSFHHLAGFSILNGWFSLQSKIQNALDYFNCLFWGFWSPKTLYVPAQGGLLNPLAASFFILGLLKLLKGEPSRFRAWVFLSLGLFLMPGLLSENLQILRISQLFPLVFVIAAWGLERFLGALGKNRIRGAVVVLVFLSGACWDSLRLAHGFKEEEARSQAMRWAYGALRDISAQKGAGFLFLDFGSQPLDADPKIQGLEAALTSSNAVEEPALAAPGGRWAAVVTNVHFQPFLQKRFPGSGWRRLEDKEPRWNGGLVLGFIPLDSPPGIHPEVVRQWAQAYGWFRQTSLEMNDICNGPTYQTALKDLLRPDAGIFKDRFLAACYWERLSDFYYIHNFVGNYDRVVACLQKAIDSGYPAGHLYYKLGSLFLRKHRYVEARQAFQKALAAPGNQTPARQALDLLSQLESKKGLSGSLKAGL